MNLNNEACIKHLQGMVRIPTVSNPDPEKMDYSLFFKLHSYLEESYPLVHKHLKKEVIGRAGLLYHWEGTGKSEKLPLLLMAHQDVVPEGDHDKWLHGPYSGDIADGRLWGRGTTDSKCNIMAHMEAIEHLLSEGFQPDYDLYLAYGYNEEVMGGKEPAAKMIAEELQRRGVELGCVIDECGGCGTGKSYGIDGNVCEIIVGEKGYADFEFSKTDKGGHSCQPGISSALGAVARAAVALEENPLPYRLTEVVKKQYEAIAPYMKEEKAELYKDMEANWDKLVEATKEDGRLRAMLHTTTAVTMAEGSAQANVLPERASIIINCRPLEGDTLESLLEYFKSVVADDIEVRLIKGNEAPPVSPTDSDSYRLLQSISEEKYPGIVTIPAYLLGGTDSRYFTIICKNVYRFGSFFGNEKWGPAHSVNECIPCENLVEGPEFFTKFIKRYGNC